MPPAVAGGTFARSLKSLQLRDAADVGFTVDANALQSYLLATEESGMWQVRRKITPQRRKLKPLRAVFVPDRNTRPPLRHSHLQLKKVGSFGAWKRPNRDKSKERTGQPHEMDFIIQFTDKLI
ncbi:hypothetical protein F2P81_008867 [Scophthalmus maximus]|uniref:Uncharacterized protein n=1 Tax=Scophthalmus maximus TaxID=52904 RepID=A0A6A4SX40_SCOMX|nr:hypothetical protein F2P81_008867 [Scophthalmus maximus]